MIFRTISSLFSLADECIECIVYVCSFLYIYLYLRATFCECTIKQMIEREIKTRCGERSPLKSANERITNLNGP